MKTKQMKPMMTKKMPKAKTMKPMMMAKMVKPKRMLARRNTKKY
jgi:hypothetical protein